MYDSTAAEIVGKSKIGSLRISPVLVSKTLRSFDTRLRICPTLF